MRREILLWLVVALTAGTSLLAFYRILSVQRHQNDALRSIMCQAEHAVQVRPGIPPDQRRQALNFYRHAVAQAHLKPCP